MKVLREARLMQRIFLAAMLSGPEKLPEDGLGKTAGIKKKKKNYKNYFEQILSSLQLRFIDE